jgi:HKD family nuclease
VGGTGMLSFINQPFDGSLGSRLEFLLERDDIKKLSILVAYAKKSGVIRLLKVLKSFKGRGGTISVTVGIDQSNTSKEALELLYEICDELYVYHNEKIDQTYHPKFYMLEEEKIIHVFTGSNNLTAGGLYTNNELCTYNILDLEHEQNVANYQYLLETFSSYSDTSVDLCKKVDNNLIDALEHEGYIKTEDKLSDGLKRSIAGSQNRRRLFGSMTVSAPPIELDHPTQIPVDSDSSDTPVTSEEQHVPFNLTGEEEILSNIDTYETVYGSYSNYVNITNGFTKTYYHIPQGVHIGHIFYIIKALGDGFTDYRLNLFNQSTTGEHGTSVRQTNYKVGVCMELMLLDDYRLPQNLNNPMFTLRLSKNGEILYHLLNEVVTDDTFYDFATESPTTWRMQHNNVEYYIDFIKGLNASAREILFQLLSNLPIFRLLVDFISQYDSNDIPLSVLYGEFWKYQPVVEHLDLLEITVPSSQSSLEHRMPFLISLLRSFFIVDIHPENREILIKI